MAYKFPPKKHRRTYTESPYTLVRDHETGNEEKDLAAVFDGDIDSFLTAGIRQRAEQRIRGWGNDGDMGPCPYCGQKYKQSTASVHFIPCCYCNALEHPGCGH